MLAHDVEEKFRRDPALAVVDKIVSSAWRWGYGKMGWNEMVDCHRGLRTFRFAIEGSTITIDHATGCNEMGSAQHSRIFLDGSFGFLVHIGGIHAMTIGFSFARDRTLLVQQVQLARRKGNRWLYRLPNSRMAHVLDGMAKAFPQHRLMLADGDQVALRNLESYGRLIDECGRWLARAETAASEDGTDASRSVRQATEALAKARASRDHLAGRIEAIARSFGEVGDHRLGATERFNGIDHREVTISHGFRRRKEHRRSIVNAAGSRRAEETVEAIAS
jgi:hypothetical protein